MPTLRIWVMIHLEINKLYTIQVPKTRSILGPEITTKVDSWTLSENLKNAQWGEKKGGGRERVKLRKRGWGNVFSPTS